MSDFDAVGFAADEVRGARTFKVNGDGWLTGIFYRQVWTVGENLAVCRSRAGHVLRYYPPMRPEPPEPDTASPHGIETCKHGFYAFFDGSNDWHDSEEGQVAAMVKGYGQAMVGPRGFRSMKAQILALVVDKVSDELAAKVAVNYRGIPWFPNFATMISEFPPRSGREDN